MDRYLVKTSSSLHGSVQVSGAKNAVLPIMAATLLAKGKSRIQNVPYLKDVKTMSDVLRVTGARVEGGEHELLIDTTGVHHFEAPYELVKTMRASFYLLGPLVARYGRSRVSLPGGCAWGPRPVDLHLKGLEALGATVRVEHGFVEAVADQLKGAEINFPVSSVGATANILMASVLAEGTTVLNNAAMEPEITNLVDYLIQMGAKIEGRGSRTLTIEGVPSLEAGDGNTIGDRIEAGTFLVAAVMTRGKVKVEAVDPKMMEAELELFKKMGVQVEVGADWAQVDSTHCKLHPVNVTTDTWPGFPTDMQAQFMAMMATVSGTSVICDTVYPDRFKHIPELDRLGVNVSLRDNVATVEGGNKLTGAPVMASDLRASAALVLAGLVAEGETEISRIYHMDRGYEDFSGKLAKLGATVQRIHE